LSFTYSFEPSSLPPSLPLSFSNRGKSNGKDYECHLEFLRSVTYPFLPPSLPPSFSTRGKSNGKDYECHLEFLRSVKKAGSHSPSLPPSLPPSFSNRGKSNGKDYECHLEFLRSVKKEGSVWKVLPRSIQILLKKEDNDTGFWERLLKDKKLEKTNVKVRLCPPSLLPSLLPSLPPSFPSSLLSSPLDLLKKESNDTGFWERLRKDKKLEKINVKVRLNPSSLPPSLPPSLFLAPNGFFGLFGCNVPLPLPSLPSSPPLFLGFIQ